MESKHPIRPDAVEAGAEPVDEDLAAPEAEDAAVASEPSDELASAAEAESVLEQLQDENDKLLRLLAERDNQFRRMQREQLRQVEFFRAELMEKLLPVIDDFERALKQVPEDDESGLSAGLRLVEQRLEDSLTDMGLTVIEAVGERFDPRFHEAVIQLPNTDAEKGVIVQELQRGYRLGDRVIRPSKVAVAG